MSPGERNEERWLFSQAMVVTGFVFGGGGGREGEVNGSKSWSMLEEIIHVQMHTAIYWQLWPVIQDGYWESPPS